MQLFTVNLCIRDWPCLVVGGGAIALPKARRMVEAGARVTVIAPVLKEPLEGVTVLQRQACEDDLAGMRLAIFATDDRELNARLYREALRRGILSAAVDDLEACDFYMPAVLKRGELEIAVSSGGRCPAFAVWVRDRLAEIVDAPYGEALERFARIRERLRGVPMEARGGIFKRLLALDFLGPLREGRAAEWEATAEHVVAEAGKVSARP